MNFRAVLERLRQPSTVAGLVSMFGVLFGKVVQPENAAAIEAIAITLAGLALAAVDETGKKTTVIENIPASEARPETKP